MTLRTNSSMPHIGIRLNSKIGVITANMPERRRNMWKQTVRFHELPCVTCVWTDRQYTQVPIKLLTVICKDILETFDSHPGGLDGLPTWVFGTKPISLAMSDRQVLAAIGMKTGGDCRYFELVHLTCGDLRRTCFACVGKHSLFFLRQDLNGPLHDDADVYYSLIGGIVQDENSDQHCLLTMTDELPNWQSDRLFIKAENRPLFLRHLRCNWQTDHMWRLGRVVVFPLSSHPITKETSFDNYVLPYHGYRWTKFQGYRFMVPERFTDQANSIQDSETGEYVDEQGISLVVHVHEAFSLEQLSQIYRDNIRWVAADYKVQLCAEEKQFYVIKNCSRDKRMNLAADLSQWHQWELIIRTRQATILCLVMRRQYMPPSCCNAQDIAVLLRCPEEHWKDRETSLLLESYTIADSLCTDSPNVSVYRDVVQAKLDALRFDEEGIEWVATHLKLKTCWEVEAVRFVKSIWKLFCDDKVDGYDPKVLEMSPQEVFLDAGQDDEWASLECIDNFQSFFNDMLTRGEGLPLSGTQADALDEDAKLRIQHSWHARVARYFAWAVDGGLLGARFNLELMIEGQPLEIFWDSEMWQTKWGEKNRETYKWMK